MLLHRLAVEGLAQFVLGLSPAARGRSPYAVLWLMFEPTMAYEQHMIVGGLTKPGLAF